MKTLTLYAHVVNSSCPQYYFYFYSDPHFLAELRAHGYDFTLSDKTSIDGMGWTVFFEANSIGLETFSMGFRRKLENLARRGVRRSHSPERDMYNKVRRMDQNARVALLIMEGVTGMPENYNPRLHLLFPIVFTWNDSLVDGKRFFKYRMPQPVDWPACAIVPFRERKLLVNISANKYCSHTSELYSERRGAIRYFQTALPGDFDLYGLGWNQPATISQRLLRFTVPFYPSYRGTVDSKAELFPQYRFALCYENSSVPGWITEKMLDCMRCGCVPIYLGAPNISEYVDPMAFIDRRRFGSYKELANYLTSMTEERYQRYLTAIRGYLKSARFAAFLSPAFANTIIGVLDSREKQG